jgi:sugar phosphate isomerase/epimerase
MKTIKGPGIFLAQFADDAAPFNTLASIGDWAAKLGFTAVQIPSSDPRLIDLQKAADSKSYCDEIKGMLNQRGLQITELSTHLQGQLVASAPRLRFDIRWLCATRRAQQRSKRGRNGQLTNCCWPPRRAAIWAWRAT